MDTENNQKNKPTVIPETTASRIEKIPTKKIKRQATQEELDHPLHRVKLAEILESLVGYYGWEYLADQVNILCFRHHPTMKVSLKFLRKMDWAREHVEDIYIRMVDAGVDPKKYRNKKNDNNS